MSSVNSSPILLIIFNRPDTTQQVFDAISRSKPPKLYISSDGPREGNENDKINCNRAREIVKKVDWECDVHYRFLEKNLGCGWGPASAISWAFENEDRLIILEDDCVPSLSFFPFCDYLLEKFKNDTRIWLISGRSHQTGSQYFKNQDYIFSHYGHSWGWATWKRCWQNFDMEMKDLQMFLATGGAINVLSTSKEGKLLNKKYARLCSDKKLSTHVWDFQFGYSIIKNGGLSIVPAKNLIKNIGCVGTHTNSRNEYTDMKAAENFRIDKEPQFVTINRGYEVMHFNNHIRKVFGITPLYKRIIIKILNIFRWQKNSN